MKTVEIIYKIEDVEPEPFFPNTLLLNTRVVNSTSNIPVFISNTFRSIGIEPNFAKTQKFIDYLPDNYLKVTIEFIGKTYEQTQKAN